MEAGAWFHFVRRLPILIVIGLLISYPLLAQKGKTAVKSPAAVGGTTAQAQDPQAAAAQTELPQADSTGSDQATPSASSKPPISAPARQPVSAPVKPSASASSKPPASAASKPSASAPAEQAVSAPAETAAEPAAELVVPVSTAPAAPAPTVPAAPASAETTAPVPASGWMELAKTVGAVGLILSLILGGYMLFRKFAPQYIAKRPGLRSLRLIETLPMGDKRSVVLVQAGTQKFLLASTPGQITLLTALSDIGGAAAPSAASPTETSVAPALTGSFRNLYEQEKKTPPARPAVLKALPPDIRGKMQELRRALEG